jgi:hypothetical protein
MISTKRLVGIAAAGAFALAMVGMASVPAATASVKSHPMVAAKVMTPRPGGPMIRATGGGTSAGVSVPTVSENWSGYAAVTGGKKFSYVHSEWVQPAIKCPGVADQLTSNWVGLDGFNDGTVEQDGTDGFCGGPDHTTPIYEAWYEMFPAPTVNVFAIQPGDIIEASVQYVSSTKMFQLTISDLSSGRGSGTSAACSQCQRSSAEWIIERPAGCNGSETKCFLFELANFHTATMTDDTATAGKRAQSFATLPTTYPIYMVQPLKSGGFVTLDSTGPVLSTTDGFVETWNRSGQVLPITLSTKR